ncbi:MAG TPA: hypothetical protein VK735_06410 [Pseudonocardia sp.]|uniref:hypothetical protein n=1 Tax=Pseudonocardia sp. TaxID=60912 RepID=UPI002C804CEF|nr:hypothetical protein [Pseudonocardia sp.]HTF47065.1 hypothetical protein [Pseudonocardia sp.]
MDLETAAAEPLALLDLAVATDALEAVRDSLDATGLVLLGEIHGILQTAGLVAELVDLLDISLLALEWPAELTGVVATWVTDGELPDHPYLWLGDGRITAGHLHLLKQLGSRTPPVSSLLFDATDPGSMDPTTMSTEQMWTARDHAMAENLASALAGSGQRCLAVAGNAHTHLTEGRYGRPMGAWLADDLPELRSITVRYGPGRIYNGGSHTINSERPDMAMARLHLDQQDLLLDLPAPAEATVPHRQIPADRIADISDISL